MEIIENFPQNLISFFVSPPSSEWLLVLEIFFIVLSLLLLGIIIFGFSKSLWFKFRFMDDFIEILTYKPIGTKKIEKDWRKILAKLDSGLESEYKLAIIEANNVADEALKKMGYSGETLTEKLEKVAPTILSDVQEYKDACQVRNNIVYDPNYNLSLEKAKKTLEIYENLFKELNLF
jgi:hypothetical protein